jgi:hypothetical protein
MKILAWGLSLPFFAFLLHLVIWKVRLPYKQTRALTLIFYGTFLVWVLFAVRALTQNTEFSQYIPSSLAEYVHIFFLFNFLTFVYIGFYTLLEVDSPSLLIVRTIRDGGELGVEKAVLHQSLGDEVLVIPRVQDLLRDNMAILKEGKHIITPKGSAMIRFLQYHRKLIGIDQKGG